MSDNDLDEFYMMEAIQEAKKAERLRRSPYRCRNCLRWENHCRAHNLRETNQSAVAHAELSGN